MPVMARRAQRQENISYRENISKKNISDQEQQSSKIHKELGELTLRKQTTLFKNGPKNVNRHLKREDNTHGK